MSCLGPMGVPFPQLPGSVMLSFPLTSSATASRMWCCQLQFIGEDVGSQSLSDLIRTHPKFKARRLPQPKPWAICCLHSEGSAQMLGHDTGQSSPLTVGRGWQAEGGSAEPCGHSLTLLDGSGQTSGQEAFENHLTE